MPYQPKTGDRIRITRHNQRGRQHSVHTGTVLGLQKVDGDTSINFHDDHTGRRVVIASNAVYERHMKGWTQTIEPA